MSPDTFLAIVNKYGEGNILGFGFDNSASLTFGENQFTIANNYNDDIQCLQFINFDSKGNPFHVLKSVEDIQSVMIRDSQIPFGNYDSISVRS